MPVGPCRVWYQHRGETLGLAMSRSLGDAIVHKCGVSAEPEVLEHQVRAPNTLFFIGDTHDNVLGWVRLMKAMSF